MMINNTMQGVLSHRRKTARSRTIRVALLVLGFEISVNALNELVVAQIFFEITRRPISHGIGLVALVLVALNHNTRANCFVPALLQIVFKAWAWG